MEEGASPGGNYQMYEFGIPTVIVKIHNRLEGDYVFEQAERRGSHDTPIKGRRHQ